MYNNKRDHLPSIEEMAFNISYSLDKSSSFSLERENFKENTSTKEKPMTFLEVLKGKSSDEQDDFNNSKSDASELGLLYNLSKGDSDLKTNTTLDRREASPFRKTRSSPKIPAMNFELAFQISDRGQWYGTYTRQTKYKSELCRTWRETGSCPYRDKCQFAHGRVELRSVHRHKRYKSVLCKNYHLSGYCSYGKRCCFVHVPDDQNIGHVMSEDIDSVHLIRRKLHVIRGFKDEQKKIDHETFTNKLKKKKKKKNSKYV